MKLTLNNILIICGVITIITLAIVLPIVLKKKDSQIKVTKQVTDQVDEIVEIVNKETVKDEGIRIINDSDGSPNLSIQMSSDEDPQKLYYYHTKQGYESESEEIHKNNKWPMLRLTEEQVNTLNESVQDTNHRYNLLSDSEDDQNPPTFVVVSSHFDTSETSNTDKIIFLCTNDDQNQCVSAFWPRVTTPELISDDLKSIYINRLDKIDIKNKTNTNFDEGTKSNVSKQLSDIREKITALNIDQIDINDSINVLDDAISSNFGIDQNINFIPPVGNNIPNYLSDPNTYNNFSIPSYNTVGL